MKEADRVPNKINRKGPTPRYIIIKMANVKERILMVATGKLSVTREYL